MATEATKTLKLGNTLFVFTDRGIFLIPEGEYSHFQQDKEGYTCLKRKHLSEVTDRDVGRLICIVCHGEAELEDFVSPLCRQMHFVLCKECVEYLKGRTDKREIFCPYCKEKRGDKAYQEEILGILFSFMPHQTLQYLELRPDTEVKAATRLTRETKVVLSNIAVSYALFFGLMSKTTVTIRNRISLFDHDNSLDCCLEELDARTYNAPRFCFDGYTDEDMKQIHENIKTTPKKSIRFSARKITAVEAGISVLLKLSGSVDGHVSDLLLESSTKEHIEEILETESHLAWIGRAEKLTLTERAMEMLPALRFHEENKIREIILRVYDPEHITEILNTENSSVSVGAVKKLSLYDDALEILPKICFREGSEIESLVLDSDFHDCVAEILKTENNSLWVGRVRWLELRGYAVGIFPKLRTHEENVMEELELKAFSSEEISELLEKENNSIWIGKVRFLILEGYALEMLPRLRIHEENVMERLFLSADKAEHLTEILREENNSIWIRKIKSLVLRWHAIGILPKLKIHDEDVMEVLRLYPDKAEHLTEILKTENKNILVWIGKAKTLDLGWYAAGILPKLGIHEENMMEELVLSANRSEQISGILKMKNKSIRIGKVKFLRIYNGALEILSRLRMHGENMMEELELGADEPEQISGILRMKNKSIGIGKVKKLELYNCAVEILPKFGLSEENEIEKLVLDVGVSTHLTEIFKIKNKNGWLRKVKSLELKDYAIGILPKLGIHEENMIEEFGLSTEEDEHITEILKTENKDILAWVGKVRRLKLENSAIEILHKLIMHEENAIEELVLSADYTEEISRILKTENKNIWGWIGRMKRLELENRVLEILPKLKLHDENVMEELVLSAGYLENISEILKMDNNSLWIGRVKRLELEGYALGILPKLKLHDENVMEELKLDAGWPEHITEILKIENSSIWIGRVNRLRLEDNAVGTLPKLKFHEENVMEELKLDADEPEHITEILKEENGSIWVGKAKNLILNKYAVEALPKLGIHGENVMEEFGLSVDYPGEMSEILKMDNSSIWVGKVRKISLEGHAEKIKDRLEFTLIPNK
ncbi:MAG: uncharacterized protein A8A55_2233 [Amphiamblys sp. WSBS2006]|nr:MAG: uncharacterized protein A8A55_2233 [Amphiamblys sp. WSBS2006]